MKLFVKIFMFTVVLISAALGISGYMMITISFENAIKRETEIVMRQYQSDKLTFQSFLIRNNEIPIITSIESGFITRSQDAGTGTSAAYGITFRDYATILGMEMSRISSLYDKDRNLVFTSANNTILKLSENLKSGTILQTFQKINNNHYIVIESEMNIMNDSYYFISAAGIDKIMDQKSEMLMNFTGVYIIIMIICLIFILFLSSLLTRPINKLASVSKRIADGEYGERILHKGNDEIGTLSDNFNKMAEAIESKIDELSLGIKQKEDFIAGFAHELKTPLTSVIGYADMIYQKELPRSMVKESALYICSEGMRLEALSLKLLDLIVLGRQDFIFEEINVSELAGNVVQIIMPRLKEDNITITIKIEEASIKAEPDLIRTLFLNLLDNAAKSGGNSIQFCGQSINGHYEFTISDNGRGIPENEICRIKEPFYMVDKSRSRRQNGTGLGLSLAEKIAVIHQSTLVFESSPGIGTSVMLKLNKSKDEGDYID